MKTRSIKNENSNNKKMKGIVLFVGGSSGIGKLAAIAVAKAGFKVHIAGKYIRALQHWSTSPPFNKAA
jgi:NADP-dependent 3-hydroxy acid dehydrogenase YdfG